jgi:mRNA interferase YafQ
MKTLSRHKTFVKDMRNARLTEGQFTKLFLYVADLLNNKSPPPESQDHSLLGEWRDFRELRLGGDILLIYKSDEKTVYLVRLGTHSQLFSGI